MSISVGGWFVIALIFLAIGFFMRGCYVKSHVAKEHWLGCGEFTTLLCIITIAVSCAMTYRCKNGFDDFHYMNTTENPVKITYIKARPFVDDYVDSIIVHPNQAIIIKNIKILNQKTIEF